MEEWKTIETSPNYEVSTFGNVRHLLRRNNLKPRSSPKKDDYICYDVNIAGVDGKQRNQKIHQLVAQAFIPNPEGRTEIDHIDRNTANNRVENLRWVTRSENCLNTRKRSDNVSGRSGVYFSTQKQKWLVVLEVNKVKKYYGAFKTIEEAIVCRDKITSSLPEPSW